MMPVEHKLRYSFSGIDCIFVQWISSYFLLLVQLRITAKRESSRAPWEPVIRRAGFLWGHGEGSTKGMALKARSEYTLARERLTESHENFVLTIQNLQNSVTPKWYSSSWQNFWTKYHWPTWEMEIMMSPHHKVVLRTK